MTKPRLMVAAMCGCWVMGACSPQMAADLATPPAERCAEAARLYDLDRNAKAGWLTLAACIR